MSLNTEELAERMLRWTRNCVDSACKMMFPSSSQGSPRFGIGGKALDVSVLGRFAHRCSAESDMDGCQLAAFQNSFGSANFHGVNMSRVTSASADNKGPSPRLHHCVNLHHLPPIFVIIAMHLSTVHPHNCYLPSLDSYI